jgi:pyruvate/2-oxoglutarate dehydrogenase complex dihydrolipoamide acyltransferase (E2) component
VIRDIIKETITNIRRTSGGLKMEYEVIMPRLGQEMTEGIVVEWYKKEGDRVENLEPLFMVDTSKANIDVESEVTGILKKILVREGETAAVGQVVAIVETEGEGEESL